MDDITTTFITVLIVIGGLLIGTTLISAQMNNELENMAYKEACRKMAADGIPTRENERCLAGGCEVDFDKDGFETGAECIAKVCSTYGPAWDKYCDTNVVLLSNTTVN